MPNLNVTELLLERGDPDDVAVLDGGRRHTYADLRRAVGRQVELIEEWDLEPGSRVGVLGANSAAWVVSYLAVMRAGHTAVPFAPVLTPDDVRGKMAHVGCESVLVDQRLVRRFEDAVGSAARSSTDAAAREALAGGDERALPDARRPAETAVLVFTSGTTSRPRAVRVGHDNIRANTTSIVDYLGLRRDDRMLVVLPFSYCFGASLLHTHLSVGASLRLCETQAFPETIVEAIADDACTGFAGVPSSYQVLLRASSFESRPLPTLRHLQQAGGRLPVAQVERVVRAQPHARVFIMYGQTEATARLAYLSPEELAERPGSVGRAIPGVTLRVADEAGADVPVGTVGEIRARGANVTLGYWDDPVGTAEKYVDGELRTGDLGRLDDEGFLFVVDRRDDFIKSWGYRVSSHEVEDAAIELTGVAAAAAVGRPDPQAGEAVVLFATVRPDAGVDVDAIATHLRSRLAKHLVPSEIRVVDQLPLNSNGKVVKNQLRDWARGAASPSTPSTPSTASTELVETGGRHA